MEKKQIAIAFGSDLHLRGSSAERRRKALNFPKEADVIVLAGDIAEGMQAPLVALELADAYPCAHVVWIAGNHENYYANIDQQIERFRQFCDGHERMHFLENDCVEIFGIKFIGCTLWSDFSILGEPESSMALASQRINDFVCIESAGGFTFTPKDCAARFLESFTFLDEELAISDPRKTVVVSHFPPGLETRNPNFEVDGLTAYFQANVGLLLDLYQPTLWIYGHNHYSQEQKIGNTRVVSHQLGYQAEDGRIPAYEPSKLVFVETEDDGI